MSADARRAAEAKLAAAARKSGRPASNDLPGDLRAAAARSWARSRDAYQAGKGKKGASWATHARTCETYALACAREDVGVAVLVAALQLLAEADD